MQRYFMRRVHALGVALGLVLAPFESTASARPAAAPAVPFDLVISNGTILDGTGLPRYRADIGIRNGVIWVIGDLSSRPARRRIEARGLFVAPGFINLHDHAIPVGLQTAHNMLLQGVTTEIVNADGGGETDVRSQLDGYAAAGLAVNVGANIGFNKVWQEHVGLYDVRPSAAQIDAMGKDIVAQLKAGAWGVSSGLDYKPAFFAKPDEVTAVVRAAAPWRTYFQNHDRLSPDNNFSSLAGMRETVSIAQNAGLLPIITHMKLQGHEQGLAPVMLGELRAAMDKGSDRGIDVYPYLAGNSSFTGLLLPGWSMEGGYSALKSRLADPALRKRIIEETETGIKLRIGGPENLFVTDTGKPLLDEMKARNAGMGETIMQLLEVADMRGIFIFGAEEDLRAILKFPSAAIACDCGAVPDDWSNRWPHPRYYGTFPRVLGHYVREIGLLSWEDAIRKMTGLAAGQLGIVDRGYLMPGMAADVTIFDPATIIDKATYEKPKAAPVGIDYVLVNGVPMVDHGQFTGAQPGKALFRDESMPTRSDVPVARKADGVIALESSGGGGPVRLQYSLTQSAAGRNAKGMLALTAGQGARLLRATSFGRLQTTQNWMSVSGVAVDASGADHGFLLVRDEAGPLTAGKTRLLLYVDGVLRYGTNEHLPANDPG